MATPFVPVPLCWMCSRYHETAAYRCDAFPEVIPHLIVAGRHDHRKPFHDEDRLFFEPVTAAAASYADLVFSSDHRASAS